MAKHELPDDKIHRIKEEKTTDEFRRLLYERGWNDYEIADVSDVTRPAIRSWRESRDLPPNEQAGRPVNTEEERKRRTLHAKGWNDREIAEEMGVSPSAIQSWRKARDLEANDNSELSDEEEKYRMELYEDGLSDYRIAQRAKVTRQAITAWRRKRGLEPNDSRLSEEEEEERFRLYREGLSDGEIAEEVGVTRSAIQAWREERGLPAQDHNLPKEQNKGDGAKVQHVEERIDEIEDDVLDEIFGEEGDEE